MEQRITVKQLDELSDKAKEKLGKWWKPKISDVCIISEYREEGESYKFEGGMRTICEGDEMGCDCYRLDDIVNTESYITLPLLSIGQMIEFIGTDRLHSIRGDKGYYRVTVEGFEPFQNVYYTSYELCDALWEACKYILEKD